MMKRIALFGAALSLTLAVGLAETGNTYVFPSAGFRYTQHAEETVLTRTNLQSNAAFLAELGTTPEAVLASYDAAGIVMEVFPSQGGQLSVAVTSASGMIAGQEASELDAPAREALQERFLQSGLYQQATWSADLPDWMILRSSAMYGSMPVWQERYVTLHLGQLYTVTATVVGREPEEADAQGIRALIGGMRLLGTLSSPRPTPAPMQSASPQPEASATPAPASVEILGELTLEPIPSQTSEMSLVLKGKTEAEVRVSLWAGDRAIASASSDKNGRFTLRGELPEEGDNALRITAGEAEAKLSVRYTKAPARLTITEPEDPVFTGERVLIRGVTEPGATVRATGEKTNLSVTANKNGVFTVPIPFDKPGTRTYTITARQKGFSDGVAHVSLTRVRTEREEMEAFKQAEIPLTYDQLSGDPSAYSGKHFTMRGKVVGFTDYDGTPAALLLVSNPRAGVWEDPLYAVLPAGQEVQEGEIWTVYLVGEGLTLPAASLTDEGEVEAPVGRVFRMKTTR